MDLDYLSNIAIEAAKEAGKVIQKYMNEDVLVEKKEGGENYASQVVTKVDKECEKVILDRLLPTLDQFDLALLSEETEDDGNRLKKAYFWCIDPLDGTLAFINKNYGYSVSIGLVSKDGTPVIGVIFDPINDTLYHAIRGEGAFRNGDAFKPSNENQYFTYITDKALSETPRSDEIEIIIDEFIQKNELKGYKEISGGGSVMNAMLVIENGPACMFKFPKDERGGGSLWDFAASACIFEELNLQATTYAGSKLNLNKVNSSFMNHEGVFYSNMPIS